MTLLNTISNLAYAASRALLLYILDWISFSRCLVTQKRSNASAAAPDAQLAGDSIFSCYTKTMKQVPLRGLIYYFEIWAYFLLLHLAFFFFSINYSYLCSLLTPHT